MGTFSRVFGVKIDPFFYTPKITFGGIMGVPLEVPPQGVIFDPSRISFFLRKKWKFSKWKNRGKFGLDFFQKNDKFNKCARFGGCLRDF